MTGQVKRIVATAGVTGFRPLALVQASHVSVSSMSQGGPEIAATV